MVRIGDTAPDFELKDLFGNPVTLEQMAADGDLILYFRLKKMKRVST